LLQYLTIDCIEQKFSSPLLIFDKKVFMDPKTDIQKVHF